MNLTQLHCTPAAPRLSEDALDDLAAALPAWQIVDNTLVRHFHFADYYRTLAFVNALAFIAHREDHHPTLNVEYGSVRVAFWTHDADGLTLNDFICAAHCDALDTPQT